jgi:hypothetical protein
VGGHLPVTLAAGSPVAADAPDGDPERLQGTWRVVSDVFGGMPQPVRDDAVAVTGDQWVEARTPSLSATADHPVGTNGAY